MVILLDKSCFAGSLELQPYPRAWDARNVPPRAWAQRLWQGVQLQQFGSEDGKLLKSDVA